jgi:hypothetical protein
MLTPTQYFTMLTQNYSKSLANTATEPTVQRQTQYFEANIGKVKTVNDLLNNSQLYNYVMTAFGLSDMTYAKGLIRQVLTEGVSSSKSLANTLNDPQGARHGLQFRGEWRGDDEFNLAAADDRQQF